MDQKYPPAGLISINFALFLCKWRLNGLGKDLELPRLCGKPLTLLT